MADAVAEQIAALRDEDWAIREEAATALGTLRDARAVGPLVRVLGDADRSVRQAASAALVSLGEASVPSLVACAGQSDVGIQETAFAILADIADARAVPVLLLALKSLNWIVRSHAAKALGRIGAADTVSALLPLLQDKVKAVRVEAGLALARLGPAAVADLVEALSHHEWLVRLHAVEALGKMKSPDAVEPLLYVLFNDSDTAVREDAVRALGEIADRRATEFLLKVVKEPGLRPLAIEALGLIGDPSAVAALIPIARGEARPEDSRAIAGCGDAWNEEMLAMPAAARALGRIGDEAALPALAAALRHTVTRADAAAALVRFGSKAVPHLLPLLQQTTDDNIRYHVKDTLTQVGWRPGRIPVSKVAPVAVRRAES
ncbi:MAG: HEAT repeat domain-containing protein [Nitrospiraceae bacterium]